MCGRLVCTLCPDDIVASIQCDMSRRKSIPKTTDNSGSEAKPKWLEHEYIYKPFYNGAPTTVLPVMIHKNAIDLNNEERKLFSVDSMGNYCIIPMRWGMLLPRKPESASGTYHTHNARLENIRNSHLYKPSLLNGKRCVILADGYYEWQTTKGENHKQPYYIYQAPDPNVNGVKHLIKFAGLFNTIVDNSAYKHSCSMLTTEADSSLTWMHHRMPVFLNSPEDIDNWLNSANIKYEEALKLLPNYSQFAKEYKLQYYQVDKSYVNNSACNSEKCMQRMTVKRKRNTLDSWLNKKC